MRQFTAIVALAAGVIPSVLALSAGPEAILSVVCGLVDTIEELLATTAEEWGHHDQIISP